MTDPNASWPRPADEPRSQPFEPVSYDFAPEFTPTQAFQPPVQQPPAYRAPPVYQQPVFQGTPPQFPQAPPKSSRRGLKITLSIIGAVIVLCGVGACVAAIPVMREYGSTISAPDQLPGGLTRSTDAGMQSTVEDLKKQLNSDLSTDTAVAGYYETTQSGHTVLFAGVATLVFFPGTQLDDAFTSLNNSLPVTGIKRYPAGIFGGTVKCGSSTSSGLKLALCVWADYGTVGIGALFARTPDEAAPLFVQIREATERR